MSFVKVNEVLADGSTTVLLDGIDSNEVYYFTGTGIKADTTTQHGIIRLHDGTSALTTGYVSGSGHQRRHDAASNVFTMSGSYIHYAWHHAMPSDATGNVEGWLYGLYDASVAAYVATRCTNRYSTNTQLGSLTASSNNTATSFTGIEFDNTTSVNITEGKFKLYRFVGS
jgi:hypothetical protein